MILHLYVFMVMWVLFCPYMLFYLFPCFAGFDRSQRSWAWGGGSQWELGTAHTHTGTQHPTVISARYATPRCHILQVRNAPVISARYATLELGKRLMFSFCPELVSATIHPLHVHLTWVEQLLVTDMLMCNQTCHVEEALASQVKCEWVTWCVAQFMLKYALVKNKQHCYSY